MSGCCSIVCFYLNVGIYLRDFYRKKRTSKLIIQIGFVPGYAGVFLKYEVIIETSKANF